jgi:serine protease Do
MIAKIPVGESAKVKILRDGKEKTVQVKVGKRPEEKLAARGSYREQEEEFGISVSNLTPEIAQQFNTDETAGVIVTQVESGGKGDNADVRVGDIIKEINRRPIKDVSDYQAVLAKVAPGETANLFIHRKDAGFLVAKLTK